MFRKRVSNEELSNAIARLEAWAMRCDPGKGQTLILNRLDEIERRLNERLSFVNRPKP